MADGDAPGFPPAGVMVLLRLEGLALLAAALAGFHATGGNWWLFALLILAPDVSALGMLRGPRFGAQLYNAAHTYSLPAILAALAWSADAAWLVPYLLIWIAHIGADRALGYGLKYPETFWQTHLGRIGKAKRARRPADAD